MNRRQKIIVSVTGIFLVLLLLVGLTYAYFLTQVTGNTKDKSISINTANLELLFDDSTPIINGDGLLPIYEGEITTKAAKKHFTINSLDSNAIQYVTIKLTNIEIDPELAKQDFKWILYENGEWITTSDFDAISTGQEIELISNVKIDINSTKKYDLYVYIEETGVNQSEMMNKQFSASINIEGYSRRIVNNPENLLNSLEMVSEEYVSPSSGLFLSSTAANKLHSHTDYLNVDYSKVLFFKAEYGDAVVSIVFFDQNKEFISGLHKAINKQDYQVYDFNGIKLSGNIIEIPENTQYYIINVVTAYYQEHEEIIYHYHLLDKNLTKIYNLALDYDYTNTLDNIKIANFGDSIFGNFASNSISSFISKYYGATTYNVAVGGTMMSSHPSLDYDAFSMYNLADAIVTKDFSLQDSYVNGLSATANTNFNTLKNVDFSSVDYITIGLGTNDFTRAVPLYNEANDLDVNTYIGAARYSLNKIIEKYPNTKIILLTPIYRWWDENSDVSNKLYDNKNYLKDFGESLKQLKLEYSKNVYVFDGLNDLGIDITTRKVYFDSFDKTHINEFGRKLYAYKLGKYIETLEDNN